MTAIHQNSLANHHAIDDASHHSGDRNIGSDAHGRQMPDDRTTDSTSGSVNISFNAHMRLRAYQDQKNQLIPELSIAKQGVVTELNSSMDVLSDTTAKQNLYNADSDDPGKIKSGKISSDTKNNDFSAFMNRPQAGNFSERITGMLSEVQNNIVQASEPGYHYLVNMLHNYRTTVEDPQQLQEIMRKEEFYLSRRKPFMDSADFQSYSQVLNQFSNIVERQQYA